MSGVNFERAKLTQNYQHQMQRPSCHNCQLRLAHDMQCGLGGFYVQTFGICTNHQPTPKAAA